MKKIVLPLIILSGVVVGAIVYLDRQKALSPVPTPVAETPASETTTPPPTTKIATVSQDLPPTNASQPEKISAPTPVANTAPPDEATNAIHKAVDALLSAKSAKEKHELFQELLKSGQLDQAMAELKQRALENPNDPEIPTTLGEAQLNKVKALHDAGGDLNEIGILAMQADQSFNAALKIDPQNWEANFVKASSMYYWPADPTRDADVVQRLSGLIDQQETMASQPQFVQSYIVLGNEYVKLGQPDKALATWQLGLQKFPNDPTLLAKINGQ